MLVHRPFDDPLNPLELTDRDTGPIAGDRDAIRAGIERRFRPVVDELVAQGRTVVLVEPIPEPRTDFNVVDCLSSSTTTMPAGSWPPRGPARRRR